MVVEAGSSGNEVEGAGDVGGLQFLHLLGRLPLYCAVCEIAESNVACAEIHGRRHTQLECGVEAHLAQDTHREAGIPPVLIG